MGGKVKAPLIGGTVGGLVGGPFGAAAGGGLGLLGNSGKSQFEQDMAMYNSPRPDFSSKSWVDAGQNKLNLESQQAASDLAAQGQSQLATARAQLASKGGLRGGAAERLASSGMNQQQEGLQNLRADKARQAANLAEQGAKFEQEQAINEWTGNRAAQAQLMASRGKSGRGGVTGGLGKVTGK